MDKQKRMRQPITTRDYAMIGSCRLVDITDPINDTYVSGKSLGASILVKWVTEEGETIMGNAFATGMYPDDPWCMLGHIINPVCNFDPDQPVDPDQPCDNDFVVNGQFKEQLEGWGIISSRLWTPVDTGVRINTVSNSYSVLHQSYSENLQEGVKITFTWDKEEGDLRFMFLNNRGVISSTVMTITESGTYTATLPSAVVANGFGFSRNAGNDLTKGILSDVCGKLA